MSIKKKEDIAEALRQDNIELQTSGRIMAENLEILRGKLAEITLIANEGLSVAGHHDTAPDLREDFRQIIKLAAPIEA
ncbi:hypothetical protein D3C76_662660 [compost metagenome]